MKSVAIRPKFKITCEHCGKRVYMSSLGVCPRCNQENNADKLILRFLKAHKCWVKMNVGIPSNQSIKAIKPNGKHRWECTLCGRRFRLKQLRKVVESQSDLDVVVEGQVIQSCSEGCKNLTQECERQRKIMERNSKKRSLVAMSWRNEMAEFEQVATEALEAVKNV